MSDDIDLTTLADKSGVSPRTVRYYIYQGLLPSPGKGPGARYDVGMVDRLRLIKEYQDQGLPLSKIRERLEELDEEGIRAALGKPLELPLSESALSYVRKVIGKREPDRVEESSKRIRMSVPMSPKVDVVRPAAPVLREDSLFGYESPSPSGEKWQVTQSNWERTKLTRNVELNVRRPLTPKENKLVDKLLEAARKIFAEEQ